MMLFDLIINAKGPMNPYKIIFPDKTISPLVASIPHAGETIPPDIATLMREEHLQNPNHTDWYLDELFDFLPR